MADAELVGLWKVAEGESMPWGALRCLAGTNGGPGHYEGFMGQYCH